MTFSAKAETADWASAVIVGEYATAGDDRFVVIVFRSGKWLELSLDEFELVRFALEAALGMRLPLSLGNATDFASRIIFPPSLAERPLYQFTSVPIDGLRALLTVIRKFGMTDVDLHFTDEAVQYVKRCGAQE